MITEQRLPAEGFLGEIDYSLPLPAPQELAGLGDPRVDDQAMAEIAKLVTGQEITDPAELGRVLRTHILTHALMDVLGDKPSTSGEVLDLLPRKGAYNWGEAFRRFPQQTAAALARFVALLSRGSEPGRRDPAVPAYRDAPVDPAAQPAAPGHQPEPEVRLVRGGESGDGDHPGRGRPRVAARRVLPSLRPFRMGGAFPGEGPAAAGAGPGEDLPRGGVQQAPGPAADRRDRRRGHRLRDRPARRGHRPRARPRR